ncbi:MAG: ABC transporter ATP-binding protein [Hyphomicrobiales bacterium]|nr:ABC transporter ATP-binding protein [Hyphomicrobiales bacterium]
MVAADNARAISPEPNDSSIIAANGLVKTFRGGTVRALAGVNFHANPGDMIAVIGPSGSGKSTLLYALSGLIELDAGTVRIDGVTPASSAEWVRLRARHIGLVFQDDWLLDRLTAAENVELPMIGVEPDARARCARVRDLLARVNATDFGDRMPAGLSGGERQRIAIARSLANRPRLLLADEPTGELDTVNSRGIVELLIALREQEATTVIMVTHEADIASVCDRRFAVQDGRGRYVD